MIKIVGVIGEDVQLAHVVAAAVADTEPILRVEINSIGGDVETGVAIYEYLRNYQDRPVHTYAVEECMSIASVIFLAGSRRFAGCPIMIHLPMVVPKEGDNYNTQDLAALSSILEDVNKRMIKIYKEATGADEKTLELLMSETSYLSPLEAVTLNFAHETTAPRALAYFQKNNLKLTEMAKMTMKEFVDKAKAAIKAAGAIIAPDVVALSLTDVNGEVLTIEREEGVPVVGDVASPDGTFTFDDGSTITVAEGVITEMTEPAPDPTEELEALRAENETLRANNQELTATLQESITAMETAETELTDLRARAQRSTYKAPVRAIARKQEEQKSDIVTASRERIEALRNKNKN